MHYVCKGPLEASTREIVTPRMRLNLEADLSGWVFIRGRLGRHCQYLFPRISIRRRSNPEWREYITLPIVGDGLISELIELPDDVSEVAFEPPECEPWREPGVSLRRVGWLKRSLSMVHRVLRTYVDLSKEGRRDVGSSLLRNAVFDLPNAYRLATARAPTLQERPYPGWSARFIALNTQDRGTIVSHIACLTTRPQFHVLLTANDSGPDAIRATLASLQEQLYRDFTCTVLDTAESTNGPLESELQRSAAPQKPYVVAHDMIDNWLTTFNDVLSREQADHWTMLLRAGDVLSEHALYWFSQEISARRDAAIVYSDDDTVDGDGKRFPYRFKPDWSLAHLCSTNYIGDAVVFRGGAVAAAGGLTSDCLRYGNFDLLLRVVDVVGEKVAHIPAVLMHRRAAAQVHTTSSFEGTLPSCADGERVEVRGETSGVSLRKTTPCHVPLTPAFSPTGRERTCEITFRHKNQGRLRDTAEDAWEEPRWCLEKLREHLQRHGTEAEVEETQPGCRRIRYRLPEDPPLVSIIVPTRDALPLLRQCVESVLARTTYPRFEVLVVDNQSADPEALEYLHELTARCAVRVLRYDRPFNYSAINNFAVHQARGEMVCLLNNDTAVISSDWLEEMAGHLLQQRVGAVGARLLYTDGRVQHGGVTVGPGGCADHLHAELPREHRGYCQRAMIVQELSAVTAACMLTWKQLYQQLGGFNEKRLPVAFNDVDYCLRLQEAGYQVIYTPHAELYHYESASRGPESTWRKLLRAHLEMKYLRKRWRARMRHDPYYNPNLSYEQPNFTLNWNPRVKKPWLR